jgi:ketosteroid isomerase-like protein
MSADGTDKRRVTDGARVAWSPDGTKLAVPGIFTVNLDGTGRTLLPALGSPQPSLYLDWQAVKGHRQK